MKIDIKEAVRTVTDVIRAGGKGQGVKASKELISLRKEVCSKCPHYKKDRCELCGCFVNLKSLLLASRCPGGFWEQAMINEMVNGERSPGEYIKEKCCG